MRSHELSQIRIPIRGMDCTECATGIERSLSDAPGVEMAQVSFTGERATVRFDPAVTSIDHLYSLIRDAGYEPASAGRSEADQAGDDPAGRIYRIFGLIVGVILLVVVAGEIFGVLDRLTDRVPWYLWLAGILVGGYPVFRNVLIATVQRRIVAHSLMTVGAIAAIAVGEWPTAAVVVFFMRVGVYIEEYTAGRARGALKDLTSMMPRTALLERNGRDVEVPVDDLAPGDVVLVRPGMRIPADGEVISGSASIDQSSITGESMPVQVRPGEQVYAATIPEYGGLRIRIDSVGDDTTFGRVIQLVTDAESQRGNAQRMADRFATWYLPFVLIIAALTLAIRQDAMAMTAVLVVACSCSFALATPIAVLASVASAAKRGLLVKGGRYLEALASADILLIDKTGTLTYGRPVVTDVISLADVDERELLRLAGLAEYHSEHPIAASLRDFAVSQGIELHPPEEFAAVPGAGVRASVDGRNVTVGSRRLRNGEVDEVVTRRLEREGKTVVEVGVDGVVTGLIAVSDQLRPDAIAAIEQLRQHGFSRIEMLTGDNRRVASAMAARLGIDYQAELLPEDKINAVRTYQEQGHTTIMVGDGVNDAPALAQADTGIALGVAGSDVAIEVAPVSLMRDDWMAVPHLLKVARRTVRVIRMNIGFTAVYNIAGLALAAFGILPPVLAAAAQSIPDIGILANSSRLLKDREEEDTNEAHIVQPAHPGLTSSD